MQPNLLAKIKSVRTFKEQGKIALVRVDYNSSSGEGADETRIEASLETLKHLLQLGTRIILVAHSGRPHGPEEKFSLKYVAEKLADKLELKFVDAEDKFNFPSYDASGHVIFSSADIRKLARVEVEHGLGEGNILFTENIRFYEEETELSETFGQQLASLADIYVNDAFSVSHHAAVSVSVIPKHLPSYGGFQLIREIENLNKISNNAPKPLVLLLGGSKISEKAAVLERLAPQADHILIGGALANLFFLAKELEIGESKVEQDGLPVAKQILRNFKDKILLPVDVVVAKPTGEGAEVKAANRVARTDMILDIGPETILNYANVLKTAGSIIWNGPMGLFEQKQFSNGTSSLARLAAARGRGKAFVVVGGGETLEALNQIKMKSSVDFVSTAGGAMLAFLGGEDLPGLMVLMQ